MVRRAGRNQRSGSYDSNHYNDTMYDLTRSMDSYHRERRYVSRYERPSSFFNALLSCTGFDRDRYEKDNQYDIDSRDPYDHGAPRGRRYDTGRDVSPERMKGKDKPPARLGYESEESVNSQISTKEKKKKEKKKSTSDTIIKKSKRKSESKKDKTKRSSSNREKESLKKSKSKVEKSKQSSSFDMSSMYKISSSSADRRDVATKQSESKSETRDFEPPMSDPPSNQSGYNFNIFHNNLDPMLHHDSRSQKHSSMNLTRPNLHHQMQEHHEFNTTQIHSDHLFDEAYDDRRDDGAPFMSTSSLVGNVMSYNNRPYAPFQVTSSNGVPNDKRHQSPGLMGHQNALSSPDRNHVYQTRFSSPTTSQPRLHSASFTRLQESRRDSNEQLQPNAYNSFEKRNQTSSSQITKVPSLIVSQEDGSDAISAITMIKLNSTNKLLTNVSAFHGHVNQQEVFMEAQIPPGDMNVVLSSTPNGLIVERVSKGSVVKDILHVGDRIVGLDGVDVSQLLIVLLIFHFITSSLLIKYFAFDPFRFQSFLPKLLHNFCIKGKMIVPGTSCMFL